MSTSQGINREPERAEALRTTGFAYQIPVIKYKIGKELEFVKERDGTGVKLSYGIEQDEDGLLELSKSTMLIRDRLSDPERCLRKCRS